ncbi:transglycosylase domain-containing protein [Embleya sp. NBC_00896]|uniref:transglycosylase domain-containing protein n=1 Tax=Embleya sp. NBC_00896 TaxID=2975961 RepID=UPI00386B6F51|nr:penicillin-binding protein [Embleya sp. NBC_00896]
MSEHRRRSQQPRPEGRGDSHSGGASGAGGGTPPGGSSLPAESGGGDEERPLSRVEARQAARGGRRAANGSASGGRSRSRGTPAPGRKKRFIDYPRFGKTGVRRWLPSFKQILAMILFFFASLMGLAALAYAMVEVPDPNANTTYQSNIYYYADGKTEIGRTGQVNRQNVTVDQIPKHVQHAVIAAENRSFYTDSGVSPKGLLRAGVTMVKGGATQGGSTITQQYVKNTYLTQERTFKRKFSEIFIALKVDRQMRKDDILVGYLNTAYYGRNAYGIQAAAQAYYGKSVGELNVAEGAYLATVLNAPGIYDVIEFPSQLEKVKGRWSYALDGMVKEGWLPKAERDGLQFPMPNKPKPAANKAGQAGYLMKVTDQYLKSNNVIPEADLARGGYKIVTTFEKAKQDAAVAAVQAQVTDTLKPEKNDADRYVRTGLASVVPGDGAVVALYGGKDFVQQEFNDAVRRDIQAGSTFKLFVLAAALREGGKDGPIGPESIYNGDSKIPIKLPNGQIYKDSKSGKEYLAPNEGGTNYGPVTITRAMEKSVNTVFLQLAADVGADKVKKVAIDAGLPENLSDFAADPVIALGVAPPSALDMAEAYATFAARGLHADPYYIKEVTHDGSKVELPKRETKQLFPKNVADTVNQVMTKVVDNEKGDGTGRAAKALNRPVAGKTGTTDENKSAWFVGYTPNLATSVALFREDPNTHVRLSLEGMGGGGSVHGGAVPTLVWTDYMKKALEGTPSSDFATPGEKFGKQDSATLPPTSPPPTSRTPSTPPASSTAPPTSPPASSTAPATGGSQGNSGGPGGNTTRPPSSSRPPSTTDPGGDPQGGSQGTTRGNGSNGFILGGRGR